MAQDISAFLKRIFPKLQKHTVIKLIGDNKLGWQPQKKVDKIKRDELLEDFLSLAGIISAEDIEQFIQIALTRRTIGHPAYTFKVNDMDSVVGNPVTNLENYTFLNTYQMTVFDINNTSEKCTFSIFVKEHSETRIETALNTDSIVAIHPVEIVLDKRKSILTIIVGNHKIQEICKSFISQVIKWPIAIYRVNEGYFDTYKFGKTDYKTALIIDFVYNRLKLRGYQAKFKEIKFLRSSETKRDKGIRNVTINGNDILSSQLACEYITFGSTIISFKLDILYRDQQFSAAFSLKGNDYSQLKIVLVEITNENEKTIMGEMQEEYIEMCINGIKDEDETKKALKVIEDKSLSPDKFVFSSIQEIINKNNAFLVEIINKNSNEEINELVVETARNNSVILDNTGYSEEDENLKIIFDRFPISEESEDEIEDLDIQNESTTKDKEFEYTGQKDF